MKIMFQARLWTGFFLLCCLIGCSHRQVERPTPVAGKQLTVPFIEQADAYCGPASVAMVMAMNQQPIDVKQLADEMLLPARGGSLQVELKAAIRRAGVVAYQVKPNMEGVYQAIDEGYPVIALVNLSFNWWPKWHYVVVTGYNTERDEIVVHSGAEANQHWSRTQFMNLWTRGNFWGVTMIPAQNRVPNFVDERSYSKAVIDVEHSAGLMRAAPAYHQLLQRWPTNLTALIAMGNLAYQQHDLDNARLWFTEAMKKHPTSVVALNDLAQVLVDLDQPESAFQFAKQAVRLGGGTAAEDTLKQALAKLIHQYQSAPRKMDVREE